MRLFSSVALEKAARFMFAARDSVGEAMEKRVPWGSREAQDIGTYILYDKHGMCCGAKEDVYAASSFFSGFTTVTLPPAFSTAAIADFEAPATVSSTLALIAPLPSRRTPSRDLPTTPA